MRACTYIDSSLRPISRPACCASILTGGELTHLSVCDLSNGNDAYDLADDLRTEIYVEGRLLYAGINTDEYKTIYLGEEVEFRCKDE